MNYKNTENPNLRNYRQLSGYFLINFINLIKSSELPKYLSNEAVENIFLYFILGMCGFFVGFTSIVVIIFIIWTWKTAKKVEAARDLNAIELQVVRQELLGNDLNDATSNGSISATGNAINSASYGSSKSLGFQVTTNEK
jgi:hypothetical protein